MEILIIENPIKTQIPLTCGWRWVIMRDGNYYVIRPGRRGSAVIWRRDNARHAYGFPVANLMCLTNPN